MRTYLLVMQMTGSLSFFFFQAEFHYGDKLRRDGKSEEFFRMGETKQVVVCRVRVIIQAY